MKTLEPKKMGELATLGILVATGWLTGCKAPPPSTAANAPKPVRVAEVAMTNVNFYLDSFGTLEAKRMVDLIPQVTGTVRAVLYQEGNRVTKDQVMYELDDRDYRENMVKAKAAFESSGASLRLAEDRLRRNEQLADKKMVSADTLESLKNSVAQARDSLTAAQAAVRQAELQIEYCTVRAPMDGVAGRTLVDSGNLAIQGQTRLTTIRQIDPIRVGLALAGRDLPRLQQAQARGKIPIQVLASGATDSEASPGEVEFLESTIDSVTGTIRVYGVVSNANQRLWPGQFVTVKLKIGEQGNAPVVVPNAVQIGAEGPFVFVIGPDQVAHVKRVVLGDLGEGWIWVKEGLKGSEQVVTEGQVNLVEGTKVSIVRGDTSL